MTTDVRPIRAALIGCGNSGRHYHLPLLMADPRFDLRVVASSDPSSIADLDLPDDVARVAGWEAALEQDVELVVVALPHHLHHRVARAALDAGRHVLVEKPMTVTTRQADDLIERARTRGLVLAVHHQRRWEHDITVLTDLVSSGEIGVPWRVVVVRGHQGHYVTHTAHAPHAGEEAVPWVRQRAAGGGVARLIGPHPIDHLLALVGAPVATVAGRVRHEDGEDVEAWMSVDVMFVTGAYGHVEIFRRTGVAPPRAAVWGTDGMAVGTDGTQVEVRTARGRRLIDGLRPPARHGEEIYDDVAHGIRHGRPLRLTAEHARDVVEVIELAERSAAQGGAPLPFTPGLS